MDTSFPAIFFKFTSSLCGQLGFPHAGICHNYGIDLGIHLAGVILEAADVRHVRGEDEHGSHLAALLAGDVLALDYLLRLRRP